MTPSAYTQERQSTAGSAVRSELKICIWTSVPNHYQRAFMAALDKLCDLRTVYFQDVPPERLAMGWNASQPLSEREIFCKSLRKALDLISDWKNRVHIIPGYGGPLQRSLARHLTKHSVPWANWAESSTPGFKWYARLPVKLWWTHLLAKAALGSFAIGSQAEDDFVRRGIPRSKISYLPYVSPLFDSATEPDIKMVSFKDGRRAFLFLGALSHRKGIDILLKAAAPVLSSAPDWTLILVGNDTSDGKYNRLAQALGIPKQILFRGPIQPDQIGAAVAAGDVAILPSRYDGWGVAINEALNGGLAVIATDRCGAARDLVIPGYNGFRVKAGSRSDLETALRRYTRSPHLSMQHGQASRKLAWDIDPDLNARRMLLSLSVWGKEWRPKSLPMEG